MLQGDEEAAEGVTVSTCEFWPVAGLAFMVGALSASVIMLVAMLMGFRYGRKRHG